MSLRFIEKCDVSGASYREARSDLEVDDAVDLRDPVRQEEDIGRVMERARQSYGAAPNVEASNRPVETRGCQEDLDDLAPDVAVAHRHQRLDSDSVLDLADIRGLPRDLLVAQLLAVAVHRARQHEDTAHGGDDHAGAREVVLLPGLLVNPVCGR